MRTLEDWLQHATGLHHKDWDLGLERVQTMVERMGLERPGRTVITIAGTNGKGSTARACEALLLADGRTVGLTLSPHIHRFNERIRIGGTELSDSAIAEAFQRVEDTRRDLSLTYFEFSSLVALDCFARAGVDVAVLEIGLGGRLDAFNAVDADIAVITSIGLDHQDYLGDTLELIGAEKAGILRAGQTVVLGPDMPGSVVARCAELALQPEVFGEHIRVTHTSTGRWRFNHGDTTVGGLDYGSVAAQNLALATAACSALGVPSRRLLQVCDLSVEGRLERRELRDRTLILDVAHNPAGAEFLVNELRLRGLTPNLIVCGMLRDKPHREVCRTLSGAFPAARWVLLDTHGWRAFSATDLAASSGVATQALFTDATGLAEHLLSVSAPGDVILACGSFSAVEQCQSLAPPCLPDK